MRSISLTLKNICTNPKEECSNKYYMKPCQKHYIVDMGCGALQCPNGHYMKLCQKHYISDMGCGALFYQHFPSRVGQANFMNRLVT